MISSYVFKCTSINWLGGCVIYLAYLIGILALSLGVYANQVVTLNVGVSKAEIRNDLGSFQNGQKILVTYGFLESDIQLQLDKNLHIQSQLVLEPIHTERYYHKHYSNHVFFKYHGLYAKSLYVHYGSNDSAWWFGKFPPKFGKAFNEGAGLWGSLGLPQQYELSEKIGIARHVQTRWLRGTQPLRLSASLFKPDTTPLQQSWFVDRYTETPATDKRHELDSFSVQATSRYSNLFDYYLGYRSISHPKARHETGYIIGVMGDAMVNGMIVKRLLEYTHLVNLDGAAGPAAYWTYSVHGEKNRRLYSIAYTNYEDANDQASQFQVSTGYRFKNNVSWDVGVQYTTGTQKDWYVGSRISIPIQSYTQTVVLDANSNWVHSQELQNQAKPTQTTIQTSHIDTGSMPAPTPFPGFY